MSDPTQSTPAQGRPAPGRRAAGTSSRRPGPLTVLAVVIPLLTVAVLFLVRPAETSIVQHEATQAPLSRSSVVCPPRIGGAEHVSFASAGMGDGDLTVRRGGEDEVQTLTRGLGNQTVDEALVATGEDNLAPGLLATRAGDGAAIACTHPVPVQWFTGVGAGAEHQSVLTMTNPDRGPAVADVTVLGPDGVIDVPELRGVRIRGGESMTHDLATVVPSRETLALRIEISRGRLGVHVSDLVDQVGPQPAVRDWVPAQVAPVESGHLLGLGQRGGERILTLANPGEDEVRVAIELVAEESEFTPAGIEEVRVRPGSVVETDLTDVLDSDPARGARGLRIEASGPVTASLRTLRAQDLTVTVVSERVRNPAGAVLPAVPARLVVAGASAAGSLTWQAWDRAGKQLGSGDPVSIQPGTSRSIDLPEQAALVIVEPQRASVALAVEVGGLGKGLLPVPELLTSGEVPHLRPALR